MNQYERNGGKRDKEDKERSQKYVFSSFKDLTKSRNNVLTHSASKPEYPLSLELETLW